MKSDFLIDDFVHYLTVGVSERRDPNPLFDTGFYLATNPDVDMAGVDPLLHYLLRGAALGRDPSATFDSLSRANGKLARLEST